MNTAPREGIYFVVLASDGWQLAARPFEPGQSLDHSAWWERVLAGDLAQSWGKTLGLSPSTLTAKLAGFPYAFPRGRVTKVGKRFVVYHGADLQPSMGISEGMIEQRFGIAGRCRWAFDEHEQCQIPDRDGLCLCLGIEPSWEAV